MGGGGGEQQQLSGFCISSISFKIFDLVDLGALLWKKTSISVLFSFHL